MSEAGEERPETFVPRRSPWLPANLSIEIRAGLMSCTAIFRSASPPWHAAVTDRWRLRKKAVTFQCQLRELGQRADIPTGN